MGSYILSTLLSCGITMVMSTVYLCGVAVLVVLHYDCVVSQSMAQASYYLLKVLYKQYVEDIFCPEAGKPFDLTRSTVLAGLIIVSIIDTFMSLIACILLAALTIMDGCYEYMELATYLHAGFYVSTIFLDIALATNFAQDYNTLTELLDRRTIGHDSNYTIDMMRLGTLLLVFVALKGVLIPLLNLVLIATSLSSLPDYMRRRRARDATSRQTYSQSLPNVCGPALAAGRLAGAIILNNEPSRALARQSVVDSVLHASLEHTSSINDLPRSRRLRSTRARRTRDTTRPDTPIRRPRTDELPSPSLSPVPPPPPPRGMRRASTRVSSGRDSHRPLSCTCHPARPFPQFPRTATSAPVETVCLAIAEVSPAPHSSGTQQSAEFTTTEL